ncbi:MAG: hypothetical protein JO156_05240 [Solirubrobacterales bacterium]|nr:hypothetical protein [Solirubrobacterales bacterium]
MAAALIGFAAQASRVGSGAPLTLALPVGLLIVALALWYVAFRRASKE